MSEPGETTPDAARAANVPASTSRCPYCHEGCMSGENLVFCRACVARHHAECWRALGRCGACKHPRGLDRVGEFEVHRSDPHRVEAVLPWRRVLALAVLLVVVALVWTRRGDPPRLDLIVERPRSGETIRNEALLLSGRLGLPLPEDVVVRVRGLPTPIGADGAFAASLRLAEGSHSVEVTARAGTIERRQTVAVVVDLPPRLRIDSPPDGYVTSEAQVRIVGRVEDAEFVELCAERQRVPTRIAPGPFALDVPLRAGHNDLRLSAIDAVGCRSVEVLLSMTRTALPEDTLLRATFLQPRDGDVVMSTRVRVVVRLVGNALSDLWLDGRDVREHMTVSGAGVATGQLEVSAGSHLLEYGQGRRGITSRCRFSVSTR